MVLSKLQVRNYRQDNTRKYLGPVVFQEVSPQSEKTTRRFTQLQLNRIGCHRGLVKSILSRQLRLGVTMSRRSCGGGNDMSVGEGQRFGPEVLFSRGGVSPPRLEHGETPTAALVATFFVRREAGDGFERRPAELSEVVDLVHQDALSMRYFDGIGNLTDVQIRTGLEKAARVKRVANEMDVNKIHNDLRRELTMGDGDWKPKSIPSGEKLKDELCPGDAWEKGAGKMVMQLLL